MTDCPNCAELQRRLSDEKILRERAQGALRVIRAMATLAKAQRNGVSAPDLKAICDAGLSPERTILYSQVSDPKDFTANGGVLESQK